MPNEIQVFNNPDFGEVRTTVIDREPWFVGKDVAVALGYGDTAQAVRKHVDAEDKGVVEMTTPGGKQNLTIINESGLYSLVLSSKLPAAKKFKRWVTAEVLPSIRKTGSYAVKPMTEYQRTVIEAQKKRASIQTAKILLELAERYHGTSYEQVLHANATKELTGEYLLPLPRLDAKTYSATDIGEMFGVSARKIGNLSEQHGLKTDEYGSWFKNKAAHSNREVSTFRYYECALPVFEGLLKGGEA